MTRYTYWMEPLGWQDMGVRLAVALVLGALVGLERERKHRPAGFRTMILVSLGSAVFMLAGIEMIAEVKNPAPGADLSRVLQGLIGGIGFLGAGAVIQSKKAVRGMTTAAAVWVVAALGAAAGLGLIKLVVLGGAATLFTLVVLERIEDRYFPDVEDAPGGNGKKGAPAEAGDAGEGRERLVSAGGGADGAA